MPHLIDALGKRCALSGVEVVGVVVPKREAEAAGGCVAEIEGIHVGVGGGGSGSVALRLRKP